MALDHRHVAGELRALLLAKLFRALMMQQKVTTTCCSLEMAKDIGIPRSQCRAFFGTRSNQRRIDMDQSDVIDITRQAIQTALLVGSPVLIIGMLVGLLIGLMQALTQIQDQTVSFVPKLVAMVIILSLCLPWLLQIMTEYSTQLIKDIPQIMSGGG